MFTALALSIALHLAPAKPITHAQPVTYSPLVCTPSSKNPGLMHCSPRSH